MKNDLSISVECLNSLYIAFQAHAVLYCKILKVNEITAVIYSVNYMILHSTAITMHAQSSQLFAIKELKRYFFTLADLN